MCFGLESAFIPRSMREELDTFHRKGLRQIMQMQTTYGQMIAGSIRTNNNERVYEEAGRTAYPRAGDGRTRGTGLRAVSEYYVQQRDKLFTDLLVPEESEGSNKRIKRDPLRRLTFGQETLYPFEGITRKQGRPKSVWAQETAMEIIPRRIRERGECAHHRRFGGSDYKYTEDCRRDVRDEVIARRNRLIERRVEDSLQ